MILVIGAAGIVGSAGGPDPATGLVTSLIRLSQLTSLGWLIRLTQRSG